MMSADSSQIVPYYYATVSHWPDLDKRNQARIDALIPEAEGRADAEVGLDPGPGNPERESWRRDWNSAFSAWMDQLTWELGLRRMSDQPTFNKGARYAHR